MSQIDNEKLNDKQQLVVRNDGNKTPFIPDTIFNKSNVLIQAKYKATALEENIFDYAFAHLPQEGVMEDGLIRFSFSTRVLQKLLKKENNNYFYNQLRTVAKSMIGHQLFIEYKDPETNKPCFEYYNLVDHAKYKDGEFTVYFNGHIPLRNLEKVGNFTRLSLQAKLSLKSTSSKRLYEILKSKCYVPKNAPKQESFVFELKLSELQLQMGVVNTDVQKVREVLSRSVVDYDLAVRVSPDNVNIGWRDFKRRVLDVAVNEINEKWELTRMHVIYENITGGRGGKVLGIRFTVDMLDPINSPVMYDKSGKELSEEEKIDEAIYVIDQLHEKGILSENDNISMESAMMVAESAGYDHDLLRRAIWMVQANSKEVTNPVGYMIDWMRKQYYPTHRQIQNLRKQWGREREEGEVGSEIYEQLEYEQLEIDMPFEVTSDGHINNPPY